LTFNAREAAEIGTALADQFAPQTASAAKRSNKMAQGQSVDALQELLRRADADVRKLRLDFYKKAKFANSFKWRLIENGVKPEVANEVTQCLILHLAQKTADPASGVGAPAASAVQAASAKSDDLLIRAKKSFAEGDYAQAAALFGEFVDLVPRRPDVLNTLGVARALPVVPRDAAFC
jgi:hypothetical protein